MNLAIRRPFTLMNLAVRAGEVRPLVEFPQRKRKIPRREKEIVFRYDGPRPRRALVPVAELRQRLPREARRAHDNSQIKKFWLTVTMMGGGFFGVILSLVLVGLSGGHYASQEAIVAILGLGVMGAVLGWPVAKRFVIPAMALPPMWFVRWNGAIPGQPEAVSHDPVATGLAWIEYFNVLHKEIARNMGEEEADKRVPIHFRSGDPVARYDAVSQAHLEDMDDPRRMIQGWHKTDNTAGMVKLGGLMGLGILGVVVFSLIVNDAIGNQPSPSAPQPQSSQQAGTR